MSYIIRTTAILEYFTNSRSRRSAVYDDATSYNIKQTGWANQGVVLSSDPHSLPRPQEIF